MADWYSLGGQGSGAHEAHSRGQGGADIPDQLARFLFLEEVLGGRRVLLVGGAAYALAGYLKELGARKVVCALFDAALVDDIRREGAPEGVDVRLVRPGALPGDDGAFDLVVDFGLPYESERARADRLFEIERLLSDDGFALTALPSGEHGGLQGLFGETPPTPRVEYRELAEALVDQFEVVEVYFQSLLLGYFFGSFEVELGDEGIAPHTGLMGDEPEPATTWIFAFGNAVPFVQEVTLVQLPFAPLVERVRERLLHAPAAAGAEPVGDEESAHRREELERLAFGVNKLMAERDGMRQRAKDADARASELAARVASLEAQLREAQLREAPPRETRRASDDTTAELALVMRERAQLEERLKVQQAALESRGRELGKATELCADVTAQRDTLQRVVDARDRELAEVKEELAQAMAELARLDEEAKATDKARVDLAGESASVVERLRSDHLATRDELERTTKELLVVVEDAERLERENVRMDRELSELRARADLLSASLFEAQRAAAKEAASAAHARAALEEAQQLLVEERARGDRFQAQLEQRRSSTDAAER